MNKGSRQQVAAGRAGEKNKAERGVGEDEVGQGTSDLRGFQQKLFP